MKLKFAALFLVFSVIILIPLAAFAATVDPLLTRLAQDATWKNDGTAPALALQRIIALEDSGDPGDPRVGVILHLEAGLPDLSDIPGATVGSVRGSIATLRLPLSSLDLLFEAPGIRHLEASRLAYPTLDVAVPAGNVDQVWNGAPAFTGADVLVGVIDSGVDWRHEDFKNTDGTTRIKAIWDLFGNGTPPAGFDYGAEYTESMINAGNVAEVDRSGHGTHVTGMAAGNGQASGGVYKGVAFQADILFAKPYDDQNGGFPSDKTIDAINYMVQKAQSLGQPIAINMSLGGHSGPHDGTTAQEVVVNEASGPGVAFCIAAGNEGESFIHDSAPAASGQVDFYVQSNYTPNPGTGDDFAVVEIWVEQGTSVSVTTPANQTVGPVAPGNGNAGYNTSSGVVVVDNASQGTNPANGDQVIYIQLDDQLGTDLAGGNWTISFSGGTGSAHMWSIASTMFTGFPNSDNSYSVGTPGTAAEAITVAAWKSRNSWPSSAGNQAYGGSWGESPVGDKAPFSSVGPTRDEREKPDISAPGMAIISCYSQDTTPAPEPSLVLTGNKYFVTQGTSMACPFTCGVTALLLQKNPALTSAEIKAALRGSASTDSYTGATWNALFGAGKIDAAAAIAAIQGTSASPNGDVDLDGSATVLDVILLVNYILDAVGNPLSPEGAINANVNGDGVINALDLVRIVAFILGTDSPDKNEGEIAPAVFAMGNPYLQAGQWWVDVSLSGPGLAAGQFALNLPGAVWDAARAELADPSAGHLAARAVGLADEQIRVLLYDLDNELPASGVTIRLPFRSDVNPAQPVVAGILVAGPDGQERETLIAETPAVFASSLVVSPNPMTGSSRVSFRLNGGSPYTLSVFDLRGRLVRTLERGTAGEQPGLVGWDGRDGQGRELPSGVYFVRLAAEREILTRKVMLTR
jgi:subtilisin family serine protease